MLDAHAGLAWVRDEIAPLAADLQPALPSEDTSLCEFLRDGRALCLLTTTLASSKEDEPALDDKAALPKNLQRSLHQVTTFHALERVQFFIKWCRATAALDAHFVFSSVQLLDEQNDKVVCACLDALRTKFRPHLKSSGLWVQKSASSLLAAASPAAAVESDNQSSHDTDAPAGASSSGIATQETAVRSTAAAAVASPAPVTNKLSAFLSKFPSETNVLAPVAVAPAAAAVAEPIASDDSDSDSDGDNNAEDEPVETYEDTDGDIDDYDDDAVPQPRAPHLSAFSPRSSLEQSSVRSSLSFSFTSDPRHHESFTDEQHQPMNLSFSSVLSSPPASPKPATRLRIPSIFERNTAEKTGESSSSSVTTATATTTTTDRRSSASSATSSTKDEATPRKLQIPSAFAAAPAAETPAPAIATDAGAAAVTESSVPKPVSKLSIPAAFSRSSSTSTSSNASEKATSSAIKTEAPGVAETVAETAAVVESVASASESAAHKTVSRLSIPPAFARSSSTSMSGNTSERLSLEKSETASSSIEPASPSPASVLTRKPSKLKIPSVFAAAASSSALDVSAPVAKPVEAVVDVPAAGPVEKTESVEKAPVAAPAADKPTTPTAAPVAVRAVPQSPFAAFVGSAASTGPPSTSRSTSSSSTTPASKLAAFLSTVEVASAFALPSAPPTEAAKATAEPVSFSDDESDSDDDAADADDHKEDAERVTASDETAPGLPSDNVVAPSEEPSTVVVSDEADAASRALSDARVSIDQFDERLSDDDSVADAIEADAARASERSDDEDEHHKAEMSVAAAARTTAPDEVEVEQHSIEHHDHADSEQPFFVVEEVSLSKPATSSKLYAFLHSVDSAQTHRFSHTSAADDVAPDAHVEVERTVGSVRSASTASRHSSARDAPAHKEPVDESTTSEHSDHSPRASVTSLKLVASADVILEKERLSGENLALQLKLQTAMDALVAKDDAVAALHAELEALKAQLAAANAATVAQAAVAEKTLADRLAARDTAHRDALAAIERARDDALEAKTTAEAQVAHLTAAHAADAAKLAALADENAALAQELQRAKDSEEAARYSAQVAFAARDEAEERLRSLE